MLCGFALYFSTVRFFVVLTECKREIINENQSFRREALEVAEKMI
jgi:hypothetical protein